MNPSDFYLKKRQQEQDNVKKLLIASFIGSTLLHGILIAVFPSWRISQVPEKQEKPIELILVDKPKPKPIETKVLPKPKPKPKPIETKVVQKPKPKLTPGPKAKTPPKPQPRITPKPQVTTPTPPKPQPETKPQVFTSQPREVITTPFPTENTAPTAPVQTENTSPEPASNTPVATNSPPPPPKPITDPGGVSCAANCQPKYPSALNGAEGSAGVRLTISSNGDVTGANLVNANSNATLNRQALLAARRMRFDKINNQAGAIVTVKINFTVKGSEFDRLARERQAELERERKAKLEEERKQREAAAREAELERERQAKLEEERQKQEAARQAELEKQRQQESSVTPANSNNSIEKEREEEMIRKFRERIQQQE